MPDRLKAPFPWFGGKSRVAHVVWERFGNTSNYVEPCVGSMAVPLGRPHAAKNETVNDLDCYIANFWRATQADPDAVAAAADWPVNEADLEVLGTRGGTRGEGLGTTGGDTEDEGTRDLGPGAGEEPTPDH